MRASDNRNPLARSPSVSRRRANQPSGVESVDTANGESQVQIWPPLRTKQTIGVGEAVGKPSARPSTKAPPVGMLADSP
jgi:hypothetical protein